MLTEHLNIQPSVYLGFYTIVGSSMTLHLLTRIAFMFRPIGFEILIGEGHVENLKSGQL